MGPPRGDTSSPREVPARAPPAGGQHSRPGEDQHAHKFSGAPSGELRHHKRQHSPAEDSPPQQ